MQRRFARLVPVRSSRPARSLACSLASCRDRSKDIYPPWRWNPPCLNNANVVEEDVRLARPFTRQVWGKLRLEIRVECRSVAILPTFSRVFLVTSLLSAGVSTSHRRTSCIFTVSRSSNRSDPVSEFLIASPAGTTPRVARLVNRRWTTNFFSFCISVVSELMRCPAGTKNFLISVDKSTNFSWYSQSNVIDKYIGKKITYT